MSEKSLRLVIADDDPYAHVPNEVMRDTKMPLAARGFFALLLGLPRDRDHSLPYFVRVAGVNKDTVCKYFRILEENGYLRRFRARGEHGVFGTNIYELHASPYPKKPDMVKPDMVFSDDKELTLKENNPLEPPKGGPRVPEPAKWKPQRFEAFWKFYRERVNPANRGAARKAWDKLKLSDETIDQIAAALVARLRTDSEWRRGIGRPHASTYLNGQMWMDAGPTDPPPASGAAPAEDDDREENRWIT